MSEEKKIVQITEDELKVIIKHTIEMTDQEMEKQFERFKREAICGKQFVTYMLNVAVGVCGSYIKNTSKFFSDVEEQVHIRELFKAIAISNGIEVVEDTEQITKH